MEWDLGNNPPRQLFHEAGEIKEKPFQNASLMRHKDFSNQLNFNEIQARLELGDYEIDSLSRLQRTLSRDWDRLVQVRLKNSNLYVKIN